MSDTTTNGIRIQVESQFLPEHSDTDQGIWVFAYTVTISNVGDRTAQLLSRHWIITDGWDKVEEVQGAGVVGEQPILKPGTEFTYTSFCPLPTPTGTMHGSYQMQSNEDESFDAIIEPFILKEPGLN